MGIYTKNRYSRSVSKSTKEKNKKKEELSREDLHKYGALFSFKKKDVTDSLLNEEKSRILFKYLDSDICTYKQKKRIIRSTPSIIYHLDLSKITKGTLAEAIDNLGVDVNNNKKLKLSTGFVDYYNSRPNKEKNECKNIDRCDEEKAKHLVVFEKIRMTKENIEIFSDRKTISLLNKELLVVIHNYNQNIIQNIKNRVFLDDVIRSSLSIDIDLDLIYNISNYSRYYKSNGVNKGTLDDIVKRSPDTLFSMTPLLTKENIKYLTKTYSDTIYKYLDINHIPE